MGHFFKSKFRMFFFAWQFTVVNRNETKQRSMCPKQGSEREVIVLSPLLTMVSVWFHCGSNNMGHISTEHLFPRLGTFAFPILECLLHQIKIKHCAWNKVNSY